MMKLYKWDHAARNGLVSIKPASAVVDDEFRVVIKYGGRVQNWQIGLDDNGGEKIISGAAVHPRKMWLPYDLVWYPMTAAQLTAVIPYTTTHSTSRDDKVAQRPIPYQLTIAHRHPMELFASDYIQRERHRREGHWVTEISVRSEEPLQIIGGMFQVIEAQGEHTRVTMIASNLADDEAAERMVHATSLMLDRTYTLLNHSRIPPDWIVELPDRLTLIPLHASHYPLTTARDVTVQLAAAKGTPHFRYGWLEVDESYPSGFQPSLWVLLWQWAEQIYPDDRVRAPMTVFYQLLYTYVMRDQLSEEQQEVSASALQTIAFYEKLGPGRLESFMRAYFEFLKTVDPELDWQQKNTVMYRYLTDHRIKNR